jgi:hypothetical protein
VTVRVFKDPEFGRWAAKSNVTDNMLCAAVDEIEDGLVDARLGGHLLKKRVAAPGRGKRGSYRTIVAHRQGDRVVFLFGFEKKDKENISKAERSALLKLGQEYIKYDELILTKLKERSLLLEITCHDQQNSH